MLGIRRGSGLGERAARMEALGLIPSDTGRPGGKRTGQSMGHYVSEGGPFEQAAKALLGTGWEVPYVAVPERPRTGSKLKYTCAGCSINVWGLGELAGDKGETTMANRETHVLNPAWPGLVGLCGRRVADDELVSASPTCRRCARALRRAGW